MSTDSVKESQSWPVNEQGEIVLTTGIGSNNIVGFIPENQIPQDTRTGAVRAVFAKPATETATVGNPITIYLQEGTALTVTGGSGAIGSVSKVGSGQSWAVGTGTLAPIGPFSGTTQLLITCTAGSIDATVGDAVLGAISPYTRVFNGIGDGITNETVAIRKFIMDAGVNAKLIFDPTKRYLVSGRLVPLDGQEWVNARFKRADQVQTTTTAIVLNKATDIPVSDLTIFNVGDSITLASQGFVSGSNSGQPLVYSVNGNEIISITAGSGTAGTLILSQPISLYDGTLTAPASIASGCRVVTAYALVTNRREAGATPPSSFSATQLDIDGNLAGQSITAWNLMAEYDMVCDKQTLNRIRIRNFAGEGGIWSGSDLTMVAPDIDTGWGNGWHNSAYTSTLGVGRAIISGGRIANCNGAPAAWDASNGLPTNKPAADRFSAAKNIGHRSGAICYSNNIYDVAVRDVEMFNCWTGGGNIDSSDNARLTFDNCRINQCGSWDDGTGGGGNSPVGAFQMGGDSTVGVPTEVSIINCKIRDCYRTNFNSSTTASLTLNMANNWFNNSPVVYQNVKLNHVSGSYDEPINSGYDTLVWVLNNAKGSLLGVRATGGNLGIMVQGTSSTPSNDILISDYVLTDNWIGGFQLKGDNPLPRAVIGQGLVLQTNSSITNWSGIIAASGGGYATRLNIQGPVTIDAQQASGGATIKGIRYEYASGSANLATNSVIKNVRIHLNNAAHVSISCNAGGSWKVANVQIQGIEVYPDLVTAGWDASVVVTNKLVLQA